MSLINEALKRARMEEATSEGDGAGISFNTVVTRESRRGGLRVKSLLIGASLVLAGSVIAVLIVGMSDQPRSADAQYGVGDRIGAEVLDHEEKEEKEEKSKGVSDTDVVTLPMQSVANDSPEKKAVAIQANGQAGEQANGKDAAQPVEPTAATKSVATVAPPEVPTPSTSQQPPATTVPSATEPVNTETKAATDKRLSDAALIAAVVKALRDLPKDGDGTDTPAETKTKTTTKTKTDTSDSEPDSTPSEATPVSKASPFPVFTGEVLDERFPNLTISGITRSNNQQAALINRQIVLIGDTVDDAMVERIERKRVRLKYRGKTFYLALP